MKLNSMLLHATMFETFITMKIFLPIVFLQCISLDVLVYSIQKEKIDYDDELSYQELINLNVSCSPWDSCMEDREDQPHEPAFGYHCSCHKQCWEFGTCCIDSPYKNKSLIQTCRNVGVTLPSYYYYMVDRCPDNTNTDSIWKIQCEKEWNEEGDLLILSPVTSLDTSRTYKNYYCFKCHESTGNYLSWNLQVDNFYTDPTEEMKIYTVSYNQEYKTWEATLDENGISFPVNMSFQFPTTISQAHPHSCSESVIVDCPTTWTDRRIHEKCLDYAAFIYYKGYSAYKNVHCALCNYKSIDHLSCWEDEFIRDGFFSLRYLLDINDSNGDKVGKKGKCDEDHIWDPYGKKCRKKTCAIPGYVIKNDRCVRP